MKVKAAADQEVATDSPQASGELKLVVAEGELTEFADTAQAEHIRRLEADQTLVLRLNLEGFNGPTWERLSRALVEYGVAVMAAWISTGIVYAKLKRLGIRVAPASTNGRPMSDVDLDELAFETVAEATLSFRTILAAGKWNPGRGATLATFFVGNCLLRFPNVLRDWKKERERHSGVRSLDDPSLRPPSLRSAELVVIEQWSEADLEKRVFASAKAGRDQEVLKLLAHGYSLPEIAELTGLGYRQVSNRVYRIRKLLKSKGVSE